MMRSSTAPGVPAVCARRARRGVRGRGPGDKAERVYFTPDVRVCALLAEARDVVIVTHIYPDGDAFGSQVALAEALESRGARVRVWNCHAPPERLKFLDAGGRVRIIRPEDVPCLPDCELLVALDTSELARLGDLGAFVTRSAAVKVVIDHHIPPPRHGFDAAWAEERAGATGLLVFDLIDALGLAPSPAAATALFAAIASDTGWFAFSNTTARELSAAARLVERGASPADLYRHINGGSSIQRTALLGQVLASVRQELDGRFVWSLITRRQMTDKGIAYEELDGIIDELKNIRHALIVALIVELGDGKWKVSLRGPLHVDVNLIARRFGGGGHAKAAGYRVSASGVEAVLADLRPELRRAIDGPPPAEEPPRHGKEPTPCSTRSRKACSPRSARPSSRRKSSKR